MILEYKVGDKVIIGEGAAPFYELTDEQRAARRAHNQARLDDLSAALNGLPSILPPILTPEMVAEMNANAEFFAVRPRPASARERIAGFFRRIWPWRKTKFNPAYHWTPEVASILPQTWVGADWSDPREACAHTDFAGLLGQPDREDVI